MLTDFLAFTLAHNGLAHNKLTDTGSADTGPPQSHGELPGGATWRWLGAGVLECLPAAPAAASVVLSAGIHGDETAPIEILSALVAAIAVGEVPLRVRLLILLGNVAAMCDARPVWRASPSAAGEPGSVAGDDAGASGQRIFCRRR